MAPDHNARVFLPGPFPMDRYIVISSDCHAGLPGHMYRDYVDPSLRETFARVLAEMRARYLLSFSPTTPATPGWHTLTVRLRRPGRVVARPGYMMPASPD